MLLMIPQEVLSSIRSDPIQKWWEVTLPFGTEMPGLVAFYCRDLLPPTASIAIQIVDSKSFHSLYPVITSLTTTAIVPNRPAIGSTIPLNCPYLYIEQISPKSG